MLNKIRLSRRSPITFQWPTSQQIWRELTRIFLLVSGTAICAFSYSLFEIPNHLSAGGLGGISIIINHFTGLPVGQLFWVMNLPLLFVGYFHLGRVRFVVQTLIAATLFAIFTDLFTHYLPIFMTTYPITDDLLLNAIYGAIVGGIGGGLIYRTGSTMGGTGIIARVIQKKTGFPLSQSYFFTDTFVIFAIGFIFGWERSLYGFLMLLLSGMAADYTLEGASNTRVVSIITNQPQELVTALMNGLQRGATYWEVIGGYTGEKRYMVTCTIYRSQVHRAKKIIAQVDAKAFVTIGLSHQAQGRGFVALRR